MWDSDGNRLLDGMAGLWCVNIGYGRKELAEAAYRQMLELPYYNSFFKTAHPAAIELSALLADVTPAHLNRVFFTNSGSEANETVVRLVRRYWDLLGKPEKQIIISRDQAYHGSTIAATNLGGQSAMHEQAHLPGHGVAHVEAPYWYGNGGDLSPEEYGIKAAAALDAKIRELGVERIAGFIAEPIQGAGAVIIPPASYWPAVQAICEQHDILLIVDEVICGFGRLGTWFGSDYYHLQPDLMPIAKGLSSGYLPIGAVMVGDRVADVFVEQGGEFQHGFTYSGHPAACAVALANLHILLNEQIIERVADDTGPYLRERWHELADHPLVGEARIVGFMGALELVADKNSRTFFEPIGDVGSRCRDTCFENGLIMRATRDTMIIAPPLIMSRAHIDELIELARKCLDITARQLGIV